MNELLDKISKFGTKSDENFPRIIHQIWHTIDGGSSTIPDKLIISQKKWIEYHPDYLYILWNNKLSRDFITRFEPGFVSSYDNLEYEIQRIDAIRYVFLKHIGGIYSDLDVVPRRNIGSEIVSNSPVYLIRNKNFPYICRNDLMISKPGAKLWDICINLIKSGKSGISYTKGTKVLSLTGPYMLNEAVAISPTEVCQLSTKFNPQISENTDRLFDTLEGKSWNGWDLKICNAIMENLELLIVIILLIIILVLLSSLSVVYIKKLLQI
jgi:mannosyltransferase OCH1-like enzyme